jgi:single-strand DNA-binding protein
MRSVNKVILIGNLTRDPEMRQTGNGQSIVTFGLATNREWVTSGGEKKSSAEFHECVAWARLAEICEKYLRKGKLVYVEGYLKTRSWDTEEGIRKFKTEIVVEDMIMLNKRSDDKDYIPEAGEDLAIGNVPEKDEDSSEDEENTSEEDNPPKEDNKKDENPIDKDLGL